MLACVVANSARGGLIPRAIPGVTGKAFQQGDSANPGNGSISRLFNGAGLTVGNPADSNTWLHDATWENNWQGNGTFSGGNTPGAWLVADLGVVVSSLDKAYIWNVREGTATDRGTQNIDLYTAISPTVTPATGSAYDFASGGWTLLGSYTIPKAPGGSTAADAVIDLLSAPAARYIGFDINSNYGSTFRVGFAEIEFTTVPEPAGLMQLGILGLGAIVWYGIGRRRRVVAQGMLHHKA
jgi:hypothetical protein